MGQSVLVSSAHLGHITRFLLLSDSCGVADVESPLCRKDRSVVYNSCWASPAQSLLGPSPAGLTTIFYCLKIETSPTRRARSRYFYPWGTGLPSYTAGHWVLFRRLFRLAGLRLRYSDTPPHGVTQLTTPTFPGYNIWTRTAQKTPFYF
jgi:hypothetical protein